MRTAVFAAILVAADQLTKYLAVTKLQAVRSIEIIPGLFNLSYVENPGAAWGIFSGQRFALVIFSLLSLAFITWKQKNLFHHLKYHTVIISLIYGGIIGNLIDRIRISRVIDFLDFHWKGSHFPSFNIADSAICCGAILFIIAEFVYSRSHKELTMDEDSTA
ncbi:MAG: signal peptidase II [Kiritimatiellae bacterium]|jgi:signal peptidase II|nr:signal peptidase II [Kiritimatiellia bacterium]